MLYILGDNILIWISHKRICRQAGFSTAPVVFLVKYEFVSFLEGSLESSLECVL